jgi:formamidopyrimidine-DNA glycosylase
VPELPELEILKEELREHVLGRRVLELVVPRGKEGDCPVSPWRSAMEGGTIVDIERRGKMLILYLDSGFSLIIHLMMAGQLLLASLHDGEPSDVGLVLDLGDDTLSLGQVHLKFVRMVPTNEIDDLPALSKLGHDPSEEGFSSGLLADMLAGRRGKIKSFLLDQRYIAGIGNTYADEILFGARISPTRAASSLTDREIKALRESIVQTLNRGMELGGSSEMAFVHLDGSRGSFQDHFQVKRRKGEPCFICGTPVERVSIGGRGTYFCPKCQK